MSTPFIEDLYPTPPALIEKMLSGLKLEYIEDVLDLGAGRGDISQAIIEAKEKNRYGYGGRGRVAYIDTVEINPDLRAMLKGKDFRVVHDDILSFDTFKVYHLIIGNFPFSIGAECLQRALDLIERGGGHLRCLVNAETIKNPFTNLRKSVVRRLSDLGAEIEYLPGEFVKGDRPTGVEAALIKLHVSKPEAPSIILDAMKKAETVETEEEGERGELVENNFAAAMVARFNLEAHAGIRLVDEFFALRPHILDRIQRDDEKEDYSKPLITLAVEGARGDSKSGYVNGYLSGLRKKYWELLLRDSRFSGLYTSNILTELESKLSELKNYDFNLFNIGELIQEMRGKVVAGIESSIIALFEKLTRKFAYNETIHNGNVHYYNGWKSNLAHKVNKKVVLPMNGHCSWSSRGPQLDYRIREDLNDMVKVFNYLSDERTNVPRLVGNACAAADNRRDLSGIDLRYFEITFYKKGTAHIKFKDAKLLAKFNIFASQRKGWLPPAYGKKARATMNEEERGVVDSFHGDGFEVSYSEVVSRPKFYIVEEKGLLQLADGAEPERDEPLMLEAPEPDQPKEKRTKPQASPDLAARRSAAARKAVATRQLNLTLAKQQAAA